MCLREELTKAKLIRDDNIVFVTSAFGSPPPTEADIEDLLEPSVFHDLVTNTYTKELAGRTLALNPNIPRIVKRYEAAFEAIGIEFHKTRPAREFLARIAKDPAALLTASTRTRFEQVFAEITRTVKKHTERSPQPFR